jgi:alcohol dehydrogenase class IV
MASFDFSTAARIIFNAGSLRQVGALAKELTIAPRALVVVGKTSAYSQPLFASLEEAGIASSVFHIPGEPTVAMVSQGLEQARSFGSNLVIGFGGGSALDAGKAIAILLTNPGDIFDYLELIGKGKAVTNPPLPYIAIPTTAGTGTEVTRNAVIGSPEHHLKVSLRGMLLLPKVALIDPEVTYSLPPAVTASTGLDALTQLIEPFVSNKANPMTDAICREGIKRAARSLQRAFEHGSDAAAREDMCVASLFGGMALANARLGAAHGFASPVGGQFPAPHGVICGRILPIAVEINVRALKARQPENPALARYDEVGQLLTGNTRATAQDAVTWVKDLCAVLGTPGLGAFGVTEAHFDALVTLAAKASSMQGNPIKLTDEELREVLERAL